LAIASAGRAGLLPPGSAWGAPELPALLAVTTASSVITGLQSTNVMLAFRRLEPRRISTIELVSQVAGLAVMIIAGLATGSIWSLVVGNFVSAAVTTAMSHLWLPGPRNRLAWDRAALTEIFTTGRWILLSSLVYVLAGNIDRLVLGGTIDATTFGLYVLAL